METGNTIINRVLQCLNMIDEIPRRASAPEVDWRKPGVQRSGEIIQAGTPAGSFLCLHTYAGNVRAKQTKKNG